MRTSSLFFALCLTGITAKAQQFHLGLFGGAAAYSGDLVERVFPKNQTHAAIGLTGNYEIADHFMARAGLTYTVLSGADRWSRDTVARRRNLSFETKLVEFHLLGEFYLLNLYDRRYSPYLFAGLAIYRFNSYTLDANNQKIFLKPLSTEGQGIAGYPNSQPYHLTQWALPFGGGIKFAINDNLRVAVEGGIRRLFTDYLDDVSTAYADQTDLLAARGQQAVDLAYRSDEIPGGDPLYPAKGTQRGGATNKDYYYMAGLHLSYRLGGENLGKGSGARGRKGRLGCPANIY